jgi:hypothetical protein
LECRFGDACRFSHLTSTNRESLLAERQRLSAAGVTFAAPSGGGPSPDGDEAGVVEPCQTSQVTGSSHSSAFSLEHCHSSLVWLQPVYTVY